jgi:YesN/AraC family two-component response regulator
MVISNYNFDRQSETRDGRRRILSLEKDILVVGEAANGDDVIKVVERTKPDILLLDQKMPKGDVVQNLLEWALNIRQPV